MFTSMLPLLPPPSSSLLPPLHSTSNGESGSNNNQTINHYQHQRRKPQSHSLHPRNNLAMLSLDERTITQRKLAIAMYGYSWLRPAGCNKTMLGRREEEIEREEVERQLREVDMQDRNAMEAEMAQRQARLEEQGEGEGEEGERDLDGELPDMDAEGSDDDDDEEEDDGEEEEDEVDLDGDIPDADVESSWVYDTRREPDTDEEDGQGDSRGLPNHPQRQFIEPNRAEQEALMNAMLDEDELGELEHQHDLDDDVPDMDMDMDMDDEADGRDLDDDVPEPEDEWQHTDTELEESEMDISVLPPTSAQSSHIRLPPPNTGNSRFQSQWTGPRDSTASDISNVDIRRVSGNMLPPPPMAGTGTSYTRSHQTSHSQPLHTPASIATDLNTSALISSSVTGISTGPNHDSILAGTPNPASTQPDASARNGGRRNFFNPAGARRNLFAGLRGTGANTTTSSAETSMNPARSTEQPLTNETTLSLTQHHRALFPPPASQQSGTDLFTPPTRVVQTPQDSIEPQSRTRSGRILGGIARRRRRDAT